MRSYLIRIAPILVAVVLGGALGPDQIAHQPTTAETEHRKGVELHGQRCLTEASQAYARTLELEPPEDPTPRQRQMAFRFAPRLFLTANEPFELKDFVAILHPTRNLIAYHLFWDDDIDFPDDNDPCDHEIVWVEYDPDKSSLTGIITYFHGRLLRSDPVAVAEALANQGRPRVLVQWGKHGSMPFGWEQLRIVADSSDSESSYYPVGRSISLLRYLEGTCRKLQQDGRRMQEHPLGRSWPRKFDGTCQEFSSFPVELDPTPLLQARQMIKVSRWNSATINQHFLRYNFRPKSEWPD
ncbi:MAG: hypothetical protein AB1898_25685 [Acidobacteriota bacterium]